MSTGIVAAHYVDGSPSAVVLGAAGSSAAATIAATTAGGLLTVPWPASPVLGQRLLMVVGVNRNRAITVPAGWTQLALYTAGSTKRLWAAYHDVTSGDISGGVTSTGVSIGTADTSTAGRAVGRAWVVANTDAATPLGLSAHGYDPGTTTSSPVYIGRSTATARNGSLYVLVYVSTNGTTLTSTASNGYSVDATVNTTSPAMSFGVFTKAINPGDDVSTTLGSEGTSGDFLGFGLQPS